MSKITRKNLLEELHSFAVNYHPESRESRKADLDEIMHIIDQYNIFEDYPEFAEFMQDCHDEEAATYRATDSDQMLYNKQALDTIIGEDVPELPEIDDPSVSYTAKRYKIIGRNSEKSKIRRSAGL